jgi:TRAP-type C4-dicarboxylate transport system permease small subunit
MVGAAPRPAAAPSALRRTLDLIYDSAAGLAAVFMVLLLVMVLLSILSRQLHFNIAGIDAYAGYMMAGAGFLALAHTLKRGEHIRVTLLLGALHGRTRHALEVWALVLAVLLAGLFAVYIVRLAWLSRVLNDVSTSSDATPLWIPQLAMALGTLVLLVAFIDELVLELRGERVVITSEEASHNE